MSPVLASAVFGAAVFGTVVSGAPSSGAVQVGAGNLDGFEIDGNMEGSSGADWSTAGVSPVIDDTTDSGFQGSSRELKPSAWVCNSDGHNPSKGNVERVYVRPRAGANGQFLDLAWVRADPNGDVNIAFEFNQQGTAGPSPTSGNCAITRTPGDLLVSYDFSGTSQNPNIQLYAWSTTPASRGDDGSWVDQNLTSAAAKAAVNTTSISDGAGGQLAAGRFGEATINIGVALAGSGTCNTFGLVNARSRASNSMTAALQDRLPTTGVNLSNCPPPPAGTLTVNKVVNNNFGGTLTAADFPLFINDNPVTSGVANSLPPGNYTVSETQQPGYGGGAISGACAANGTVTLGAGQNLTCTITNNDVAPTLTVTKIVKTDDGGTAVVGDFPLFVGSTQVTSGAANTFAAGTYTVSETGRADYAVTIGGDCASDGSITLRLGQVAACTVTNDDKPATLTVTKVVRNNDGGAAVVGDFDLFVGSAQVTSGAANTLAAGTYTVSEDNLPGYVGTIGGDCAPDGTITLGLGETAACTITNDDVPDNRGHIVVQKVTLPIASTQGFPFTADYDNDGFSLGNGQSNSSGLLVPGTYSVAETVTAGWTLTGVICSDGSDPDSIDLDAGETVTCVFTNTQTTVAGENVTPTGNNNPGPETDSTTQTQGGDPTPPLQSVPVQVLSLPAIIPATASDPALSPAAELPRTGAAGLREETLLALALMFAGLSALALGRRRSGPADA
ncbi:MAG: hypothetical protein M3357_03450 [Actinomycetota bacterium]|nr:hypothetical protein [Actinomycetota bacterium]